MEVTAEQRATAAQRSVEARKRVAEQAPAVVDWDAVIARFRVMMAGLYRR